MSYSFSVRASNKIEASEKIAIELEKVIETQPVHSTDRAQAQAAADAFIDLLIDDDSQDISVSVNGSIWSTDDGVRSASVGVSAALSARITE